VSQGVAGITTGDVAGADDPDAEWVH
jgi:hypothetical protein